MNTESYDNLIPPLYDYILTLRRRHRRCDNDSVRIASVHTATTTAKAMAAATTTTTVSRVMTRRAVPQKTRRMAAVRHVSREAMIYHHQKYRVFESGLIFKSSDMHFSDRFFRDALNVSLTNVKLVCLKSTHVRLLFSLSSDIGDQSQNREATVHSWRAFAAVVNSAHHVANTLHEWNQVRGDF